MGFLDQAQKIIEYNRGLLNDKSYLQDLSKPLSKKTPSKVDAEKLKENAIKQSENHYARNAARRMVILILVLLITLACLLSIFLFQ